jgi:hypothetical protein
MMSLAQGKYFSLNGAGKLVEEYDVPAETCAVQVDDFLKKLRDRELLVDVD